MIFFLTQAGDFLGTYPGSTWQHQACNQNQQTRRAAELGSPQSVSLAAPLSQIFLDSTRAIPDSEVVFMQCAARLATEKLAQEGVGSVRRELFVTAMGASKGKTAAMIFFLKNYGGMSDRHETVAARSADFGNLPMPKR